VDHGSTAQTRPLPNPGLSEADADDEARWIRERDAEPKSPEPEPRIRTGTPDASYGEPRAEPMSSQGAKGNFSHDVFDRMGAGMATVRAFDLGELEIEQRFDAIEQSLGTPQQPAPGHAPMQKPDALDAGALARELAIMAAEGPVTRSQAPADLPASAPSSQAHATAFSEDDPFERALNEAAKGTPDFGTQLKQAAAEQREAQADDPPTSQHDGSQADLTSPAVSPSAPHDDRPASIVPKPDASGEVAGGVTGPSRALEQSAKARKPIRFIKAEEPLSAVQAATAMVLAGIHGLPAEPGPIARGEGAWSLYEEAFREERMPRGVFDEAGLGIIELEPLGASQISEPLARGPVILARKRAADAALVITAQADGADGQPAFLTLDPTGSGTPETLTLPDLTERLSGAASGGTAGLLLAYADG
jgi:hypothetical protein